MKKKKLSTILIVGISLILILLSIAFTFSAIDALKFLGYRSISYDQDNNLRISADLLREITKKEALQYSRSINEACLCIDLITRMAGHGITGLQNTNTNKIVFRKTDNDIFVYNSPEDWMICYFGNEDHVPKKIYNKIDHDAKYVNIFKYLDEVLSMKAVRMIWFLSKEGYLLAYPDMKSYYENIPRQKYLNYFKKKYTLENKGIEKNENNYFTMVPYKDISGAVVSSIIAPVYNVSNELVAHAGIDFDSEKLSQILSDNRIFIKDEKNTSSSGMMGFCYVVDKEGYIITFPAKFSELFSVPGKYLHFDDYLEENKTKLKESTNPQVREFAEEIDNKEYGVKILNLKGKNYVCSFSAINKLGWTLGLVVSEDSLFRSTLQTKVLLAETIKIMSGRFTYIAVLFLIISLTILIFFLRHYLFKPVNKIKNGIKKLGTGDFNINIEEKGAAELVSLAKAFNYLGKEMREYIENLKTEITARQKIESEIQIAEKIQRSVLPDMNQFPTKGYFEIAAILDSATNISGDFYDFFYINEDEIALVIADVSGKGIPAAFFMAMSKALIKKYCLEGIRDPGIVLKKANKALCLDNKAQMFVTVSLNFYNIKTGQGLFANAGHHQAIRISDDKFIDNSLITEKGSIALGIFEDAEYKTYSSKIEINELIVLFTDGAFECISKENEEYGIKRLKKLIFDQYNLSPKELCNILTEDIKKFEYPNRFDDITIIAARRLK